MGITTSSPKSATAIGVVGIYIGYRCRRRFAFEPLKPTKFLNGDKPVVTAVHSNDPVQEAAPPTFTKLDLQDLPHRYQAAVSSDSEAVRLGDRSGRPISEDSPPVPMAPRGAVASSGLQRQPGGPTLPSADATRPYWQESRGRESQPSHLSAPRQVAPISGPTLQPLRTNAANNAALFQGQQQQYSERQVSGGGYEKHQSLGSTWPTSYAKQASLGTAIGTYEKQQSRPVVGGLKMNGLSLSGTPQNIDGATSRSAMSLVRQRSPGVPGVAMSAPLVPGQGSIPAINMNFQNMPRSYSTHQSEADSLAPPLLRR